MQQERVVFGAGPLPSMDDTLYVLFVEPAEPGVDTFYAEDPAQGLAAVQAAYPNDRLTALPPAGPSQPGAAVPEAIADAVVADLAELVAPAYYGGITEPHLLRRLCRTSLAFLQAHPWTGNRLMVADLTGALFRHAEVAVAEPADSRYGFTVFPGRGAFAQMAQNMPGWQPPDGSMILAVDTLPDWAAPAARAVYPEAIMPQPALVAAGSRVSVDDQHAAVLAAVAAALAGGGDGQADSVRATLRPWQA